MRTPTHFTKPLTKGLALLCLAGFMTSASGQSAPLQCTIVYALDGVAYDAFNQQIDTLERHLRFQNIGLIDLNQWQHGKPHLKVSGRERATLRKQYAFTSDEDNAVVLDKQGKLLRRYQSTVDLVDMMLTCTGNESQRLFMHRYAEQPHKKHPNS